MGLRDNEAWSFSIGLLHNGSFGYAMIIAGEQQMPASLVGLMSSVLDRRRLNWRILGQTGLPRALETMPGQTPKFKNPPVVETVLGVQFEPLAAMRIVHYGLFWERVRDDFPVVEEQAALDPQIETFDESVLLPSAGWRISGRPELPRAWFLGPDSSAGQQLIQLQTDRFLHNWRRTTTRGQAYPSYDQNREQFIRRYRSFLEFVDEQQLGAVAANQCEVTYVNHIPVPETRQYGELLRECFPVFEGKPADDFLPSDPEQASFQFAYRIDENRGRLHISCRPRSLIRTGERILELQLTARVNLESPNFDGILQGLDVAHYWVVCGFKSFTSEKVHSNAQWGLEQTCRKTS